MYTFNKARGIHKRLLMHEQVVVKPMLFS